MYKPIDVSFIIPAYNVAKYIGRCIDSILQQEEISCEIIIVNDGSTDKTAEVLKKYQKEFGNFLVIDQKNSGVSAARNKGLMSAVGEYILFIDGDDYLKGIKKVNNLLNTSRKNNLDIIRGYYEIYDEEKDTFIKHDRPIISYEDKVLNSYDFLINSIDEHYNEVVPWLGMFRRGFLIKNGLLFPENIGYEEDQLFFLDALLCNENTRIMQANETFYVYSKRGGSATKSPSIKQALNVIDVVREEFRLLEKHNIIDFKLEVAAKKYISSSFYQLTSIYGRVSDSDKKSIAKALPKDSFKHLAKFTYDRHQKIKILLFLYARWYVDLVYKYREHRKRL